jgi:hypothetical protein
MKGIKRGWALKQKCSILGCQEKVTNLCIDSVFHQLNALVIKTLKYSKTV